MLFVRSSSRSRERLGEANADAAMVQVGHLEEAKAKDAAISHVGNGGRGRRSPP